MLSCYRCTAPGSLTAKPATHSFFSSTTPSDSRSAAPASPSTNNVSRTQRPENGSTNSSDRFPTTASPPSSPSASTSGSTTATSDSPPASTHSSTDWNGPSQHHHPADPHHPHLTTGHTGTPAEPNPAGHAGGDHYRPPTWPSRNGNRQLNLPVTSWFQHRAQDRRVAPHAYPSRPLTCSLRCSPVVLCGRLTSRWCTQKRRHSGRLKGRPALRADPVPSSLAASCCCLMIVIFRLHLHNLAPQIPTEMSNTIRSGPRSSSLVNTQTGGSLRTKSAELRSTTGRNFENNMKH
jgi:hypothetical protein